MTRPLRRVTVALCLAGGVVLATAPAALAAPAVGTPVVAPAAPSAAAPGPAATDPATHPATALAVPGHPLPDGGFAVPTLDASPVTAPTPPSPSSPASPVDVTKVTGTNSLTSQPITLALLLGLISVLPAALVMVTAFTRIVIVLGLTRSALNTTGVPPNQVIIGLSLFLTVFVMAPTLGQINHDAIQPLVHGRITQAQAFDRGIAPLRTFMLRQVRERDLALFTTMSGAKAPARPSDVATTTLIPAFIISELRTAFLIGFVIFVPFVVIDLIVAAALSSMGMMMVPPSLIALPFKLLLFVAADGWYLVVESLVRSFH